ncbi:MAG: riboflavin biosynthesis protein RibF [Candidatus Marinimicrobia bacterium]|nr:riboflavin biosynthesis protein RibF [Candidatus Neomarinimicrobiota bacterium]|tara:strand:+ start:5281 stop:6195 length:915 start_codon:yes stop_codon:yes gene_type:complete
MYVHNLNDTNKSNKKTIITIGNYDGFHLGHRFLIDKLNKLSIIHDLNSVLVTFNPHTKNIVSNKNFKVLTTFNDKVHLAECLSIDIICEVSFNKNLKNKSYEDFINMIVDKYNPSIVLFGYDNKIGKNQKGDFEIISKYLRKSNIKVDNCEAYYNKSNKKVTTTAIKENILNYNIEEANKLLGRNYSLNGKVVKGENRGKSLGYPTANIEIMSFEQLIPPNGVYSVTLTANDVKYKSICNIGFCPTIKKNCSKITLEVHVINKEINLYDKIVLVEFISFIRKEIKFNNENDLKNQIMKDIDQVI